MLSRERMGYQPQFRGNGMPRSLFAVHNARQLPDWRIIEQPETKGQAGLDMAVGAEDNERLFLGHLRLQTRDSEWHGWLSFVLVGVFLIKEKEK